MSGPDRRLALALVVGLGIATAHIVLVWGYTTRPWGDYGVFLHMIERAADGQVVYRDFFYQHPPLTLWLLGSWGAVAGTDLVPLWSATASIFLVTAALYVAYARRTIEETDLLVPLTCVGLILAAAFAHLGSAPLPLGMYSGAQPVGFLLLLAALVLVLGGRADGWSRSRTIAIGFLVGLVLLTKQDFWLPALVLLAGPWLFGPASERRRLLMESGIAALLTVGAGVTIVGLTAGWETVPRAATGFGLAGQLGVGRLLPSWRRLTVEALALAAIAGVVVVALAAPGHRARRPLVALVATCGLLTAVYVLAGLEVAERIRASGLPYWATDLEFFLAARIEWGGGLVRPLLGHLRSDVLKHLSPLLLPLGLAVLLAARWRKLEPGGERRLLAFLVVVVLAARVRRGFEHVEWFHFLLETPVYVLAIRMLTPGRTRRAMVILLSAGLLVSGWAYYELGVGPLTRSGPRPAFETARGTVHWSEVTARDLSLILRRLDAIDPGGSRPVYTFGHNGGINYFAGRPPAGSSTVHPVYSIRSPEAEFRAIGELSPPPLLIYRPVYERWAIPSGDLNLASWLRSMGPNRIVLDAKPAFDRLRSSCRYVGGVPASNRKPFYRIYDCASRHHR